MASIVLVSLRRARCKARDARITADVSQIRGIAELINSDDGQYDDLCATDNTLNEGHTDYGDQLGTVENDIVGQHPDGTVATDVIRCHASGNTYCVGAKLTCPGTGDYCADSTGIADEVSAGDCEGTNYDCAAP